MPDYGHPLEFGTFITPVNSPPSQPVQLAQLSEELGFDLVTYQDHPYQPAFHDTWTLLAWTAAQTSRIRLAANVHNVPLRPPGVLARAAISLDLLSGGRFELALGAGGFNDAVVAIGGPRLTPGQSVQALGEAIEVIRGIWDVEDRAPLRAGGEFHRVDGAKRGPKAAHDIAIWIGAIKPRMLRLVARDGDGWLPSFGYIGFDGLRAGNAIIDAEATRVGRAPREIRRLVNLGGRFQPQRGDFLQGPPEAWVEDLTALALSDGVGTFILSSDDPGTLTTFASEVIPGVRERVAAGRSS